MLAISLMRMGAKGKPFYRLVVKEKRSKRDGAYIENVGTYNPMTDPAEVELKHDRIQYWIGVGAKPTETVASLIKNNPAMSAEEREIMLKARAEKKAAAEAEREAAKKAEAERIAAEKAEAERAEAEAAAADADANAAAVAETQSAESPGAETIEAAGEVETPVEPAAEEAKAAE